MSADRKSSRRAQRRNNQSPADSEAAADSGQPWAEVIGQSADFIALTDSQARLTFLNPAGRKMAGLKPEEDIQGRPLTDYYTAASAAVITETALVQAERDGTWSGETWLRTREGREISLLQMIGVHKDENGRIVGYATLGHDISARKRAEESAQAMDQALERQARLLDLAHDAIIVREFEGRILYWNKGAERKYGWTKEEAAGQSLHTLLRTAPETRQNIERRLLAEGYWEGEVTHTRRDGTQIIVASRQLLDREGSGRAGTVLAMNRNITEQKEFERKLQASEEALHKLTAHLLQSQDEERQRISRELHDNTSQLLSGIVNRLYLVKQSAQRLDEPSKQALAAALKLTEGLADFMRIFSSSLHPSILDERGLAAAVRWYAEGIAAQGKTRVTVETPPTLPRLPQSAERSLYRVVQESISALRLRSDSVKVRLTHDWGALVVEISEESGRRLPALPAGPDLFGLSAGMLGMHERMRELGGQLEMRSSDRGTVIRAVLSLG